MIETEEVEKFPLIHKEGQVARIYFPSGKIKDGGTCSFLTKKCDKMCSASSTNIRERYTYSFISQKNIFEVCAQLYNDFKKSKAKLFQWFESGDCPKKDTKRITEIIEMLSKQDVPQFGFTRNKKLWESVNEFDDVNFVLSIEDKKKAEDLSEEGTVAFPVYKTGKINLYKNRRRSGSCGGGWYELEEEKLVVENNCWECYKKNRGCFTL